MEKKVFSVKDGTLIWDGENIFISECKDDDVPIATTFEADTDSVHLLHSTLIRTPKSDEELAEEYVKSDETGWGKNVNYDNITVKKSIKDFLAGRKSFGDKEFHLTDADLYGLLTIAYNRGHHRVKCDFEQLISSLPPPIYPNTIEVEHDGNNYLWNTLNAIY